MLANGYITLSTLVSLTPEQYSIIECCARDLDLSVDEVIRAVVNTSVRRHFESVPDSCEEVPE